MSRSHGLSSKRNPSLLDNLGGSYSDVVKYLYGKFYTLLWLMVLFNLSGVPAHAAETHQYIDGKIQIPFASAEEPYLEKWSEKAALDYLDQGAQAWTESKQCISCHTNGSYMMIRPGLTTLERAPDPSIREFFVDELSALESENDADLLKGIQPTQLAYLAAGLASWDLHTTSVSSQETDRALRLLFRGQSEDGAFGNDDCWPPLESSPYHAATVAAIAVKSAPGWFKKMESNTELKPSIQKLETYLKHTTPPHAYAQILLWWSAYYWPELIPDPSKSKLKAFVRSFQHEDGGWAMRDFASPENWGNGGRAEKLRSEPNFNQPDSDGHMTGLVCMVLRLHGIPTSDPVLANGLNWLKKHQRISGRWWTRSLNTDRFHFITYSSTCYAVAALSMP